MGKKYTERLRLILTAFIVQCAQIIAIIGLFIDFFVKICYNIMGYFIFVRN